MFLVCRPYSCQACVSANPVSDIVKVDLSCLKPEAYTGKENCFPDHEVPQAVTDASDHQSGGARGKSDEPVQSQRWQLHLQHVQRRAAEADEQSRRHLWLQDEAAAAEEAVRQHAEEEAAETQRKHAEEDRRKCDLEVREAAEGAAEKARRAEQEREESVRVTGFLIKKGFGGINVGRRKMLRTTYPLHAAVADNDAMMVQMLIRAGADTAQKDSSGITPRQQALKLNNNGSHKAVVSLL